MGKQSLTLSIMLVDKSKLSSEKLNPAADLDIVTYSQTVDGAWRLLWKNRRKNCRAPKWMGTPQKGQHNQIT